MRKRGFLFKTLTYFLFIPLFFSLGGGASALAGGKEINFPIGEMVSRGEVKFEAREKVWKNVEPASFPVFAGLKVKTERGMATIFLGAYHQVEMGQNSLIAFDQKNQLRLYRGRIDFRLSPQKDLSFKVGHLTVIGTLPRQAAQGPAGIARPGEEAIGSLLLHANGSVSIRSSQGQLKVLNRDRKILAVLAPKDSLRIPSTIVEEPAKKNSQPLMMAQVGDEEAILKEETHAGLSAKTWGVIGLAALAAGGVLAIGGGGGGGAEAPVCP